MPIAALAGLRTKSGVRDSSQVPVWVKNSVASAFTVASHHLLWTKVQVRRELGMNYRHTYMEYEYLNH